MAAGLSMPEENLEQFRKEIERKIRDHTRGSE